MSQDLGGGQENGHISASRSQISQEIRRGVRVRIAIGTEEDGSSPNPMEECADGLKQKKCCTFFNKVRVMDDVMVKWMVPFQATEEESLLDREHSIVYTMQRATFWRACCL